MLTFGARSTRRQSKLTYWQWNLPRNLWTKSVQRLTRFCKTSSERRTNKQDLFWRRNGEDETAESLVPVITNRYDGKEKFELVANVDGFHPELVLDVFVITAIIQ